MADAALNVLFVCTANICRSPYAEHRARQLLAGAPVALASAGLRGVDGHDMDDAMAEQLRRRGGDPDAHSSRALTSDLIEWADLVLTFEFAQRMRLLDTWPAALPKVFGLNQFTDSLGTLSPAQAGAQLVAQAFGAAQPDSMTWDIEDPFMRGVTAARECADQIDTALGHLVPALTGETTPALAALTNTQAAPTRADLRSEARGPSQVLAKWGLAKGRPVKARRALEDPD